MDCQRVSELLEQYFDGELSPELTTELEAALATCDHCREQLEILTGIRNTLREPVLKELQEVSFDGLWERIQTEISNDTAVDRSVIPETEHGGGWLEALKELFTARPFVPVGMGALAAAALIVFLWPPAGEEQWAPRESGPAVVAESVPTEDSIEENINNTAFVSGVQYASGTVFIDQDPDDPEAPLIVWHIQDDIGSDQEGG